MKKTEPHGFRIHKQEPLHEAFKRVILEQHCQLLELCGSFIKNPDFVTHEIRKSTKRIRAVYRLFRQATGNALFIHSKEVYGAMSQLLAEHRISKVYIETMQMLVSDKRQTVNPVYLEKRIAEQQRNHQQTTDGLVRDHRIDHQLKAIIVAETEKLLSEPAFSCDFADLAEGMRITYGQGRECLAMVIQQAETENLHKLRKRVKSVWNQLMLIKPIWPGVIGITVHQFDLLAEKLGIVHDMADFEQYLTREASFKADENTMALLDFLRRKRLPIQKSSIQTALRLFVEKPGTFTGRLEKYYRLYNAT